MTATWWDKNLPARMTDFKAWTGGADAPSRVAARKYIIGKGYKSVLDCGCGLAVDYEVYERESPDMAWYGVDSCGNLDNPTIPMQQGDITKLPFSNGKFDVVYSRHVLEHLQSYETALAQMIHVARREVMAVWFLKPQIGTEELNYDPRENIHHNRYELTRLMAYLKSLWSVSDVTWEDIGDTECIMHVMLTGSASEAHHQC